MVHHSLTRGHNGALVDWDGRQANKKPKTHIEKNRLFFFFFGSLPGIPCNGLRLDSLSPAHCERLPNVSPVMYSTRAALVDHAMPCSDTHDIVTDKRHREGHQGAWSLMRQPWLLLAVRFIRIASCVPKALPTRSHTGLDAECWLSLRVTAAKHRICK